MFSGQLSQSIDKIKRSMELTNDPDVSAMAVLLTPSLHPGGRVPPDFLTTARTAISDLSEEDPVSSNLKAHLELAQNGWGNGNEVVRLFESAYRKCERDQALALDFASALIGTNRQAEAQQILEKVVTVHRNLYSPYVDLMLAGIYLESGDLKQASIAANQAQSALAYLDHHSIGHLQNVRKRVTSMLDQEAARCRWITMTLAALVVLMALLMCFKARRKAS